MQTQMQMHHELVVTQSGFMAGDPENSAEMRQAREV